MPKLKHIPQNLHSKNKFLFP